MAFRTAILGLAVFVTGCASLQQPVVPASGLPAWDGQQIVCNKDVSFAPFAGAPLPVFSADERLGLCARAMRYVELNRELGGQSSYFGVAAISTASLAATYAPMVRRAYSASTWAFLAGLNQELEAQVDAAASKARQGGLAGFFSGGTSTEKLLRDEQARVQTALDNLAAQDPDAYAQLISDINATLNPTNKLLIAAINRNPFFKAYEAGLAQLRAQNGGMIDYADIDQRIAISTVLQNLIEAIPMGG